MLDLYIVLFHLIFVYIKKAKVEAFSFSFLGSRYVYSFVEDHSIHLTLPCKLFCDAFQLVSLLHIVSLDGFPFHNFSIWSSLDCAFCGGCDRDVVFTAKPNIMTYVISRMPHCVRVVYKFIFEESLQTYLLNE